MRPVERYGVTAKLKTIADASYQNRGTSECLLLGLGQWSPELVHRTKSNTVSNWPIGQLACRIMMLIVDALYVY